MSEVQLNRLLAQNERIREELEASKNIVKVSEACQVLLDYIKKTADPFLPNWDNAAQPNEWKNPPGRNRVCAVL